MTKSALEAASRFRVRGLWLAVSSFLLMACIGTMYGLSVLLVELPRLLGVSHGWSLAPFGAASVGLALGAAAGARVLLPMGARSAAVAGTGLWGLGTAASGTAIAGGSFAGTAAGFAIGGVGVGLAYLTIVATVGPSFPTRPLVGSAIGPLGFTTGTALCFVAALTTGFQHNSAAEIGGLLVTAGIFIAVLAVVVGRAMPATRTPGPPPGPQASAASARRVLSWLLFANALPGMLLIAALVPVLASNSETDITDAQQLIVLMTITLFLGGLLAPGLGKRIGARNTFLVLFLVRGVILIALPFVPGTLARILLLATVLFGHGAGFSLLPGLMKSEDVLLRFPINYGQVLIAWGVAGIVGVLIGCLSVNLTGGFHIALAATGVLALSAALLMALSGDRHAALRDRS